MVTLDSTIVNVALPAIQSNLGFSQAGLAWVVNAYLVTFGGLLLLAGRVGDLLGRRRVFTAGLALFTVASMLCGLSNDQGLLLVGRSMQGAGGALTSAGILGMIVTLFPDPAQKARAIAIYSFVGAGGAFVGLLLGGLLTQAVDWHWVFIVNGPLGALTWLAARQFVAPDPTPSAERSTDALGAVLAVTGMFLGIYTIISSSEHSLSSTQTLMPGATTVLLAAAFARREQRTEDPLLPLSLFRSPELVIANAIQLLMVAALFGQQYLVTLYLRRVGGYDALSLGLASLPIVIGAAVFSLRVAGPAIVRHGDSLTLAAGLGAITTGLFLFSRVPVDASYLRDFMPGMVLLGGGAGLAAPAVGSLAMSQATPATAGVISAFSNTTQQVGFAIGLAVLAAASAAQTHTLIGAGEPSATAFAGGYRVGFQLACGFAAAALSLTVLTQRRVRSRRLGDEGSA